MQGLGCTTLGGNQDNTLGALATVEGHRTGSLHDGNRLNHSRIHHACLAGNAINQDKSILSPDTTIVTTDQA